MEKKERVGPKLLAHGFAVWVAFFALYMLFTGTAQPAELTAAGVCGGLVALFDAALRARNERPLDLNVAMLRPLVPALGQLVSDIARVTGALITALRAPPTGKFETISAPPENVCNSPAMRAIATAAASLAPNTFVVGDGPEGGRLMVHQLVGHQSVG